MHGYYTVLLMIIIIFNWSLVSAASSDYENMKITSQSIDAHEPPRVGPYRFIRKRDAFDDLLDVDVEPEMDIYRDDLVNELTGSDKTLLDRKLEEAENTSWKHKSAYHRYALQIFDEVKRFHTIRSNITDYNV